MPKHERIAALALTALCLLAQPRAVPGQEEGEAEVLYVLEIDCQQRGILNEGTKSLYAITGFLEDGEEVSFTPTDEDAARLTDTDCIDGVAPFTVSAQQSDSTSLRRIQIELLVGQDSDDALFLDSLQLTLVGPDFEDTIGWDTDGGDGWCLSGDPGDSGGDWRGRVFDAYCYPCLEFSLVPISSDDSPIVDGDWRRTAWPAYSECPAP